jgi:pyruvate-formate lyase-activating enzyme
MPPAPRSARSQLERDLSSVLLGGDPAGWLGYDPGPVGSDEVLAAWRRVTVGAQHPASGSGRGPTSRAIQVYAHFAFCKMSCRFCQYWHVLSRDDAELSAYTDHLVALLALYREALGRVPVANAYFGGGTPTALTAPMLRRFLAAFRATFEVSHELTTEAHPETLDAEKIAVLADGGINRVSMGLQSLDDAVLRRVGRTNGLAAALGEHVAHMQRRGILVNVDLMLGLPSQSAASFERDLVETMALGPDTITVYRYQPVHRLPAPPADELRYSRALVAALAPLRAPSLRALRAARRRTLLGAARARARPAPRATWPRTSSQGSRACSASSGPAATPTSTARACTCSASDRAPSRTCSGLAGTAT